jgi:hypothetical protein
MPAIISEKFKFDTRLVKPKNAQELKIKRNRKCTTNCSCSFLSVKDIVYIVYMYCSVRVLIDKKTVGNGTNGYDL